MSVALHPRMDTKRQGWQARICSTSPGEVVCSAGKGDVMVMASVPLDCGTIGHGL